MYGLETAWRPQTSIPLIVALRCFAAATILPPAILYLLWIFGINLPFETVDLNVYFASSRWVTEGGRLFREVPSEYPLFANIIFAAVRYLSNLLHPGTSGFYATWAAFAWFTYLYAVYRIIADEKLLAALAWLAPAPIYFALLRYDIYPVVATMLAFFAIRRTDYIEGAAWLGVAIALKGYALFLLPAYCVFASYRGGAGLAMKVVAVALAPFLLSLLAALAFAGWDGMLSPFRFHAVRTLNGESTYDAINYLIGTRVISDGLPTRWIAQALQIGCALFAAAMRPRDFESLLNACLIAILGFMSFSEFYSPQFLLWILPIVCFSQSRGLLISSFVLSWLTYLYYPLSDEVRTSIPSIFKAAVISVSSVRLVMMVLAFEAERLRTQTA